jgi:hypothetical protein
VAAVQRWVHNAKSGFTQTDLLDLMLLSRGFDTGGCRPAVPVHCMHIQVSEDFSVPTVCLWLYRALPDVISTPDLLGPLLDHGDSFVLIQNGVGIEKELRHKLPTATIISGCSWADATIVEKGRSLTHRGRVSHLPRRTGIA